MQLPETKPGLSADVSGSAMTILTNSHHIFMICDSGYAAGLYLKL